MIPGGRLVHQAHALSRSARFHAFARKTVQGLTDLTGAFDDGVRYSADIRPDLDIIVRGLNKMSLHGRVQGQAECRKHGGGSIQGGTTRDLK